MTTLVWDDLSEAEKARIAAETRRRHSSVNGEIKRRELEARGEAFDECIEVLRHRGHFAAAADLERLCFEPLP